MIIATAQWGSVSQQNLSYRTRYPGNTLCYRLLAWIILWTPPDVFYPPLYITCIACRTYGRARPIARSHNNRYQDNYGGSYSLNKKEWICSLFKEWILEKSEIRVNLEWIFVLFIHLGVTTGITQGFRVIPVVTPKWVNNTNIHSEFTLISLFSKIHSLNGPEIVLTLAFIMKKHLDL